jgi:hypothetical protein
MKDLNAAQVKEKFPGAYEAQLGRYFRCSRALLAAAFWDPEMQARRIPTQEALACALENIKNEHPDELCYVEMDGKLYISSGGLAGDSRWNPVKKKWAPYRGFLP